MLVKWSLSAAGDEVEYGERKMASFTFYLIFPTELGVCSF